MGKSRKEKASSGWLRRFVFGGSRTLAEDINNVEEIVSPGRQVIRNFFERKLAVLALCIVAAMFVFVFVGPLFMPKYRDTYTETTQQNLPPGFDLLSVPKELAGNVKMIDSFGSFSVGVSNDGKLYVWGSTKLSTTGYDVADIPEEVQNAHIVMAAAGIDHIIAIGDDGRIYGWGNDRLGQFGRKQEFTDNINILEFPEELAENGVDVANVKKLTCGYQSTAILMNDGTVYVWGNKFAYSNLDSFNGRDGFVDVDFTLNYMVGIQEAGTSVYTGMRGLYNQVRARIGDAPVAMKDYLKGRKIVGLACCSNNICLILDDGSVCLVGDFQSGSVEVPVLSEGEYFVDIEAGTYHYTGLTNLGNVYSWGGDTLDQTEMPGKLTGVAKIFAGAFQSYAVSGSGELLGKWGLKGYLFGTDGNGADVFQRVVNGGRMTMTVGAIAVIISSVIGIIVGCLSGYFGGRVDMVLMRVTEGFSSIPFLPFALTLSAVMSQMTLSENMRIFIIMCILGVLSWTGLARLVRGQVLSTRENEFVVAAQAMGVKSYKIAFRHILPNVISVILVTLTLDFATCLLTESSLSYLGFGVQFPRPTWGNMLNGANNATIIKNFWWQWFFPSLFLAVTTICINIVGDTLRDVMDPKSSADK